MVKSLGKYVLVQVKEFPAGQANDKVYEEGGNIVLKTELASFRLRHASQSPVRSQRTDGVLFLTRQVGTSGGTTSSLIIMTGWLTVDCLLWHDPTGAVIISCCVLW